MEGEASRPGAAHYQIPASEPCASHVLVTVSTLSVRQQAHRWLLRSTPGWADCEAHEEEKTHWGNESSSSCAHWLIYFLPPHMSITSRIFLFSFWGVPTCFQAYLLKLFPSWKRLVATQTYSVYSTWGPGSLDEVSRHLCVETTAQPSAVLNPLVFSIGSHSMPQVVIIKHICCRKITHCQPECKAQYAQITCVLKMNFPPKRLH